MTPKALHELALSLPGAHEEPHFERTSFRVGKKIFATLTLDGSEAMIRVSDPDARSALLSSAPAVFFSYGGWTARNGSLGVRLANVTRAVMQDLVIGSWKHVAPRKAVEAFEGGRKTKR